MGDGGGSRSARTRRIGVAQRARKLIESDFADDRCDTRTLARRLGVSRSQLCHAYRRAYDTTIGHDIRRRRIRAACRLLRERPGELLKEVAATVGFGRRSYRTFLNSFRQEVGMAPRRYQRLAATGRLPEIDEAAEPRRRRRYVR